MLNSSVTPINTNVIVTFSDTLKILSDKTRHIFFGAFVVLALTSLTGNIAAIYSISKRKYRFIQKAFIISLALSDLLNTVSVTVNNLETFSHPLINWTLGKFLCFGIPFCQFWGMMASSNALSFLALDRYRNIIHALSKRWNPTRFHSILFVLALWIISFILSIPMYVFFTINDIVVVYEYNPIYKYMMYENLEVCVSLHKGQMTIYYIFMVFIIFVPLLSIFVWFYYNIALMVWRHRKPVGNSATSAEIEDSSTTTNQNNLSKGSKLKSIMSKPRDLRVERKIRTFKIIIALMLVFLLCRLPQYIFVFLKLSTNLNEGKDNGEPVWIVNYVTISLSLLNCTLNPLLYTFLQQTLLVCGRIKKVVNDFTCEICCCCFSNAEFEDFEKGNPFVVDNFERKATKKSIKSTKVKFEEGDDNDQPQKY